MIIMPLAGSRPVERVANFGLTIGSSCSGSSCRLGSPKHWVISAVTTRAALAAEPVALAAPVPISASLTLAALVAIPSPLSWPP